MAPRRAFKPRKRAPRRRANKQRVAKLSRPMRKAVKAIVRGEAETKRTMFYQSFNNGTTTARATGLWANRGWAVQNSQILTNSTDILQLIPFVTQGTDDWNRIGQRINVQSLTLQGAIRIRADNILSRAARDVDVYVYVLNHVSLKDYPNLYVNNQFVQLLENGEGNTVAYTGIEQNNAQPVSKQYYQVLMKKKVTLRYAGLDINPNVGLGQIPLNTVVSVANSHTWYSKYSMNLTKFLPKRLMYPETSPVAPLPPTTLNAPTNAAPFMCMGFTDWFLPGDSTQPVIAANIEQTYTTTLLFKDM